MEIDLKVITRKFKQPMYIGSKVVSEKQFLEGTIDHINFELSVLEGLHQENFEQARVQLEEYFDQKIDKTQLYPSVLFAIESWEYLKNAVSPPPLEIEQNALLLTPNLKELQSLRELGFKSFKLKIARLESANEIKTFFEHLFLHEKIRLDGNQRMVPEQLEQLLKLLKPYWEKIDYIEEPFSDHLETLNWSHPVSLALDESLPYFLVTKLPFHIKNIILKPALFGFNRSLEIIENMNANGVAVTLSSSFEGPIGIAAIFTLANYQNSYQSNSAGLDTLKYFQAL